MRYRCRGEPASGPAQNNVQLKQKVESRPRVHHGHQDRSEQTNKSGTTTSKQGKSVYLVNVYLVTLYSFLGSLLLATCGLLGNSLLCWLCGLLLRNGLRCHGDCRLQSRLQMSICRQEIESAVGRCVLTSALPVFELFVKELRACIPGSVKMGILVASKRQKGFKRLTSCSDFITSVQLLTILCTDT